MNSKSRKYLLTINNPSEHDLNSEKIIEILNELEPVYYCFSEEIGLKEKTRHIHIFIIFENARSFNTIKKCFSSAHIDKCYGTNKENRDYVFKEGKWEGDEKEDTNLKETHYESGVLPEDYQGKRNDLILINDLIKDGYDAMNIIQEYPQYSFKLKDIKALINQYKENEYNSICRKINVTYIYGTTGTGKTSYVMDKYKYKVCRITDYQHPFDGYNYEKVIMFEEFREDLPIKDMLKYLDKFPLSLPCRFNNKVACYTDIYITTNIPIEQQYIDIQRNEYETYKAFLRRINTYMEFDEYRNKFVFESYDDYKNRKFITLDEYEERRKSDEEQY